MADLADYGDVMAARITATLAAAKLGRWEVTTGPPGSIVGRTAWPSIERVDYNATQGGATLPGWALLEGAVWFAAPSGGRSGEMDVLLPSIMNPSGFARHWQNAPPPTGYQQIVSERAEVGRPITQGDVPFATIKLMFSALLGD